MKTRTRTAEMHPLTWRLRDDKQPVMFNEYWNKNGYEGLRKAFLNMTPNEIINLITEAGLKGRGGAGFSTGLKWSLMTPKHRNTEKRYLLCNADEMEPGTYKDRLLMEQLPHLLVEGMVISAFALNAYRGYIFLRNEYIKAEKNLRHAIYEATENGLLGKNILNSGFDFNIYIHTGAGRYICGEETALIQSLEGRRANPRAKPPFPSSFGVWGKPTCVNNVETLCNVPAIINNGTKWYQSISKSKDDPGTKLMGFSGRVKKPGVWELPFGITAREILEDYAGGLNNGLKFKAWQPGGASTNFLTETHLDLPMDFKSISKAGSRLGTGLAIAIDHEISIVSVVRNLEEFFSRESCGWCTPCRDGLPWSVKILQAIEQGEGQPGDIEILKQLCNLLGSGKTFCAHAPGAVGPLESAIKYFFDEFKAGIKKSFNNTCVISGIQPNICK